MWNQVLSEVSQTIQLGGCPTVLFDVDGTILYDGLELDSILKDKLITLSSFCKVALVTGRSIIESYEVLSNICVNLPCLFLDGALIYDYIEKVPLRSDVMEQIEFSSIINSCCQYAYIFFEWEDKLYATKHIEPAVFAAEFRYPRNKIIISKTPPDKFNRIYFRWFDDDHKEEAINMIKSLCIKPAIFEIKSENWSYINRRYDKLEGYIYLAEQKAIDPKQTIYFGDGENDKSLLKYVNWGVSVSSSHINAIENSRCVLQDHGNAGIIKAVEDLISLFIKIGS